MSQITLNVKDENIATVLNILENLKDGLIDSIDSKTINTRKSRYQPSTKTIVNENQKPTGKYASRDVYKSRLQ